MVAPAIAVAPATAVVLPLVFLPHRPAVPLLLPLLRVALPLPAVVPAVAPVVALLVPHLHLSQLTTKLEA